MLKWFMQMVLQVTEEPPVGQQEDLPQAREDMLPVVTHTIGNAVDFAW